MNNNNKENFKSSNELFNDRYQYNPLYIGHFNVIFILSLFIFIIAIIFLIIEITFARYKNRNKLFKQDFEEVYNQRLKEENIVRLKLFRLRSHRLRLFRLKPQRPRLSKLRPHERKHSRLSPYRLKLSRLRSYRLGWAKARSGPLEVEVGVTRGLNEIINSSLSRKNVTDSIS